MKPMYKQLMMILISAACTTSMLDAPVLESAEPIINYSPIEMFRQTHEVRGTLWEFMDSLAYAESRNNISVVNQIGMMGKFQFSKATLKDIGITNIREFMRSEELQNTAMQLNMQRNYLRLRTIIERYEGKTVRGLLITRSGILAGAHLGGVGGVLTFFYPRRYSYITVDMNGTSVGYYMQRFGGYKMTYFGRTLW